jgi:hypothetical protein
MELAVDPPTAAPNLLLCTPVRSLSARLLLTFFQDLEDAKRQQPTSVF